MTENFSYFEVCMNINNYCRLLDLGFEKDVSSILTAVKKSLFAGIRCQTVLLSATLNEGTYYTRHSLLDFKNHRPLKEFDFYNLV